MNFSDVTRIKETIFKEVDFCYQGVIDVIEYDGVYVDYNDGKAVVGANDLAKLARAFFLFAKEFSKGKKVFTISNRPKFETLGAMVDMSRNSVMKVEAVKDYINKLAALGFNMLMLYTEDTYELKEYKFFGYMRGRYSEAELMEIDGYAKSMGIEVIPCIQTLAHLSQFLKWDEAKEIRDTNDILLIDEAKTYEFIEAAISTMRRVFSSKRIHIGMDEAHDVGRGKFLDKNGYQNRFDILNRHLNCVVEICTRYDFKPMMWSDMFFRLANNGNYDAAELPIEVVNNIPKVDMVYWNYYKDDVKAHDEMIDSHKKLGREIVFAGGCAIWYGFLPWFEYSYNNSLAAMKSCAKNRIPTVFATMWGDDGSETNIFYSLALLPIYSEACFNGDELTDEAIEDVAQFLLKMDYQAARDMGKLIPNINDRVNGKEFFYADVLYDLGRGVNESKQAAESYLDCQNRMEQLLLKKDKNYNWYLYAYYLYKICAVKAQLRCELRQSYQKGDKQYLKETAEKTLPALKQDYESLLILHREQWMKTYKAFGFEVLSFRYGGVMQRLEDVALTLKAYLNGEIDQIEQLEQQVLPVRLHFSAKKYITPSDIF